MIGMNQDQFTIDGQPMLIYAGEVHYFRLPKEQWRSTLLALKAAGMNTVSTYMPWLVHEEVEGEYDFTGIKQPEHDLVSFVRLVGELGLYLIARPGPYVMAELKNEGVPYWVAKKYPDAVPTSWDGQPVTTHTLDYSNRGYQKDAASWLSTICGVLHQYLHNVSGGPIIGIQIDNEIGMLSWVSNSPDITAQTAEDFADFIEKRKHPLPERYSGVQNFRLFLASPPEKWAVAIQYDLGEFNRNRFRKYVETLIEGAQAGDLADTPLFINVHGTDQGRGETFPIGMSQLYDVMKEPNLLVGTDVYFGDFSLMTATHLYILNRLMQSTSQGWPLSSLEFNSSSGNHTDHLDGQLSVTALPLKTRLQIAQGGKVISNYLFSGGYNRELENPEHDGNSRIGIHGWRHGFGSLYSPEGSPNYHYAAIKRFGRRLSATSSMLADAVPAAAKVHLGFIPDSYMTESHYPKSKLASAMVRDLESNRADRPWNGILMNLLAAKFNFDAIDLQASVPHPADGEVLIVPTGKALSAEIQQLLVKYTKVGGQLLLVGEWPQEDLFGRPCTLLIDALKIQPDTPKTESAWYFPTVEGVSWANSEPEVRVEYFAPFKADQGEVFLRERETQAAVAASIPCGSGQSTFIGTEYRFAPHFYVSLLSQLGVHPDFVLSPDEPNVLVMQTVSSSGTWVHVLNTIDAAKQVNISDQQPLFEGHRVFLGGNAGLVLPYHLSQSGWEILYATAEIMALTENAITFDIRDVNDVIALPTDWRLLPSETIWVEECQSDVIIHPRECGRLVLTRDEKLVSAD
ncbi:beta-galactosidase [Lacticaseibacillus nasuensis]|uniref:beta-galactosidase n=1 Tax=Lacticaseibacillus nasuensis TaxID=944671 RepID=UPI00224861DC|nr:beta-galactosidase [Lacticaseibacillus nasuensis]MCX2455068.1 beta-galactosidase [Lacticaseibacillus nasuensis]